MLGAAHLRPWTRLNLWKPLCLREEEEGEKEGKEENQEVMMIIRILCTVMLLSFIYYL